MYDVVFFETFKEEEALLKKFLPRNIKAKFVSKTIQKSSYKKIPAEVISIRTQSIIPHDWSEKVKGILSRSQGFDHLTGYKNETNTQASLGYLESYCSRAVAEQALLLMLGLLRKIKKQINNFDTFTRDDLTGREVYGKTVLILGVGNIGGCIAEILVSFGVKIKGVDIKQDKEIIDYTTLDEGIKMADIIFCALPLTKETKNMLSYSVLKKTKTKPLLINISRGEVTPINDLKKLLSEGRIAGVALDVYDQEAVLSDSLRKKEGTELARAVKSFANRDDVICTPHNAFNTEESLKQKTKKTAQSIEKFLTSGQFVTSV